VFDKVMKKKEIEPIQRVFALVSIKKKKPLGTGAVLIDHEILS